MVKVGGYMTISIENMDHMQMDVLKEIGNIGAGNAMTALAQMLNKKVDMSVPKVEILEFKEVVELLEVRKYWYVVYTSGSMEIWQEI